MTTMMERKGASMKTPYHFYGDLLLVQTNGLKLQDLPMTWQSAMLIEGCWRSLRRPCDSRNTSASDLSFVSVFSNRCVHIKQCPGDQEIITDSNLSHVLCLQGRFGTALGLAQGAFNDASSRFKVDLLQAASGAVLSNILRHEKLFEKSLEVSTRVTEHSKRMLNAKNSEIRKSGYVSSFPVSSYMVASLINRVLVLVERADSVEDIKNAHDLVLDAMSVVSSTSYAFDDRTPLQLLFAVTCPEKNSTIATFSKILEADQFMEGIVRRLIEQNMDNLLSIAVEPAVIPTSNEIHSNQLVGLSIDSKPIWIQAQVPMLHGHVLSTYLNHAKRLM